MKIWIDLENSPHVPFFLPIIRDLRERGAEVIITARDFAQTKALVKQAGLDAHIIGREAGDKSLRKILALIDRSIALAKLLRRERIDLAVGHGSRGSLLASKLLRIPSLTLYDYEGASVKLFNRLASKVMTPAIIPFEKLEHRGLNREKWSSYDGLKEQVYVSEFRPDNSFAGQLGLDHSKVVITVRPPSHTAHYRSDESFMLFDAIMTLLSTRTDVQVLFTPRSTRQSNEIRASDWFDATSMRVLDVPVNGLDLLYQSDLVIGGGGTMNREAAVLGVPVISIFKGEAGAVDEWLEKEGKLINVSQAREVTPFLRKRTRVAPSSSNSRVKQQILDVIVLMAK